MYISQIIHKIPFNNNFNCEHICCDFDNVQLQKLNSIGSCDILNHLIILKEIDKISIYDMNKRKIITSTVCKFDNPLIPSPNVSYFSFNNNIVFVYEGIDTVGTKMQINKNNKVLIFYDPNDETFHNLLEGETIHSVRKLDDNTLIFEGQHINITNDLYEFKTIRNRMIVCNCMKISDVFILQKYDPKLFFEKTNKSNNSYNNETEYYDINENIVISTGIFKGWIGNNIIEHKDKILSIKKLWNKQNKSDDDFINIHMNGLNMSTIIDEEISVEPLFESDHNITNDNYNLVVRITLSPDEKKFIDAVQPMAPGITLESIAQLYLICNKDKDMTVNVALSISNYERKFFNK